MGNFLASSAEAKVAGQLALDLASKFSAVVLDKPKVDLAIEKVSTFSTSAFDEKMVHDVTIGVPLKNLDEFIDSVIIGLQLDDKGATVLKAKMSPMKYVSVKKTSDVYEIKFDDGKFTSFYGFFSAQRYEEENLAIAYAFHKLQFTTDADTTKIENMEEIKANYGRFKCMETLQSEGIIKAIKFK